MRRRTDLWTVLVLTSLLVACEEPRSSKPDPLGPDLATDAWCAANPGRCGPPTPDEPSDPSPTAAGYWLGSTVTASKCISATGAGISDGDHDGLSDYCEDFLAQRFRPALVVSPYDCNLGMEPYWAAKAFPNKGVVRVAYLLSYYGDCGPMQFKITCSVARLFGTTASFYGILPIYAIGALVGASEDPCAAHQGDSEFVTVDLKYNGATQHWYVVSAFFSAHWSTVGDHSRRAFTGQLEFPERYGGYPRVWVAEGKHANYPTRQVCEDDGGGADTCQSNSPVIRVRHAVQYNIGSARYNFINPKTCVRGGALFASHPENYGTECYWDPAPSRKFRGWSKYALSDDASKYYTALIVQFECYSYDRVVDSGGNTRLSCADWGVNT